MIFNQIKDYFETQWFAEVWRKMWCRAYFDSSIKLVYDAKTNNILERINRALKWEITDGRQIHRIDELIEKVLLTKMSHHFQRILALKKASRLPQFKTFNTIQNRCDAGKALFDNNSCTLVLVDGLSRHFEVKSASTYMKSYAVFLKPKFASCNCVDKSAFFCKHIWCCLHYLGDGLTQLSLPRDGYRAEACALPGFDANADHDGDEGVYSSQSGSSDESDDAPDEDADALSQAALLASQTKARIDENIRSIMETVDHCVQQMDNSEGRRLISELSHVLNFVLQRDRQKYKPNQYAWMSRNRKKKRAAPIPDLNHNSEDEGPASTFKGRPRSGNQRKKH